MESIIVLVIIFIILACIPSKVYSGGGCHKPMPKSNERHPIYPPSGPKR